MQLQGTIVRQAREEKAWTQEELSHRSGLGLRTVRRLEAGTGSLDSLRRVAEVLDIDPAECMRTLESSSVDELREWLTCDPIRLEFPMAWLKDDCEVVIATLVRRIGHVRRFLAMELGFPTPGVRLRDVDSDEYRILIREVPRGAGLIPADRLMAVGEIEGLEGEPGVDPTYGLPVVWIEPNEVEEVEGRLVFDRVSVVMTHLTQVVRLHAHRLLGVEETAFLLEGLGQPRLVSELIPERLSLARLRSVLRNLLLEQVPIRDLGLILETLLDQDTDDPILLTEACRRAMGDILARVHSNAHNEIPAHEVNEIREDGSLEQACREMQERGLEAVLVTSAELRPRLRKRFSPSRVVVLSREEIPEGYSVVDPRGLL